MRIFTSFFLLLSLTISIAQAQNHQEIILDKAHSYIPPFEKSPVQYQIKTDNALIINTSELNLKELKMADGISDPNLIQIVSEGGIFVVPIDPSGKTLISPETAIPYLSNKKFIAFKAGDMPKIGIGIIRKSDHALLTYWATMVEVLN